jgi:NADPH:quinone reductase-like Zn-dependent oxidoreductase
VKVVSDTFGIPIDGVLGDFIAIPAHIAVQLPASSHSYNAWAACVTTTTTVWNALYGNTVLKRGDVVLVLGKFSG